MALLPPPGYVAPPSRPVTEADVRVLIAQSGGGGGGGGIGTETDPVAGVALTAHEAAADPHTGYVQESLFDANTMLFATTDNTPTALTIAASRIVGRKSSGNISALTGAEVATILALAVSDVTGLQTALDLKAPLASPTFTGTVAAPTPTAADSTTKVATTAFVQGELTAKAPLASPVFTGNPTAPTPSAADNDTSVATTAYVTGEISTHAGAADPHTGYLREADYDANTILAATTDNTPAALTVAASTFVGRKASGNIAAMSASEAKTVLAIASTDVSDFTEAVQDVAGGFATSGSGVAATYDDSGATLTLSRGAITVQTQTGTSYTLVLGDAPKFVTMSNASASTLTVPPNSSVAFPVGTIIEGAQLGAGQVTLTAGAGVTINASPGLKVSQQYGTFGLLKTATDTWLAYGRLAT